jgi:phosphosulfolactate synthase
MSSCSKYIHDIIGVKKLPAKTIVLDPGYDPVTAASHIMQSGHFISSYKLSMACWQIANEEATRQKIAAAHKYNVQVCTGGGPFEVAASFSRVAEYLDLCSSLEIDRIEAGEGFIHTNLNPKEIIKLATERNLEVQYEMGEKHAGPFTPRIVDELIETGNEWLDAGAKQLVIEGRENAINVGLFDAHGSLDFDAAEKLVNALGMDKIIFEAPNKASQFAFLKHFGPEVELCNVRLEELLRVEIYRRGLHSDAYMHENLRPAGPSS